MMLDADIVAASPTSVWRVLGQAGLLSKWNGKPSKKGTGFEQPLAAHEHWHIDVSYLNIGGTFYYLCSILDGFSRYVVNWDLRESMTEADIETIMERAKEKYPEARPRIISDNRPQFIAKDFKEFIRVSGMTHVRTSPYYPQSNGKIERWHKSLKGECIRPRTPLSLDDAQRLVLGYVERYNNVRLNRTVLLATSRRRTCSPAVSRRSMRSEIGSWKGHENSGRFVGSRPREEEADKPIFGRGGRSSKRYAVREDLAIELVRSQEMLVCLHLGAEIASSGWLVMQVDVASRSPLFSFTAAWRIPPWLA
jgi:hypothetical protein